MAGMRDATLILLLAAGCGTSSPDVRVARQVPPALQADVAAVAVGTNQLACDIYRELPAGNLFFSPFSISTAVSMLDAGAAGETDAQLRAALHATLPGDQMHDAYGALLASLEIGRGYGAYTLATADRLFGQDGFTFVPHFLDITRDDYGAELQPVDFAGDVEAARAQINQWVSDQTEGKIPELFPKDSLDGAVLAITNAILFKGDWDQQFDADATEPGAFHLAGGGTVTAPLMHASEPVALAAIPGGQLGILPFRGQDLAMILLVPDAPDGLPAIEANLSGPALAQWIASAEVTDDSSVTLPRFQLTEGFDLKPVLGGLGVTDAFDQNLADLSGIDGSHSLFVRTAVHKAAIVVDEQGAEAAAASGITVVDTSGSLGEIAADRPFAFLIYDQVTDSILFMGRVADPTQAE
jgi:serpin B